MQAVKSIEHSRFIDVNHEIATIAGEIRLEQKNEENRVVKASDELILQPQSIENMIFSHWTKECGLQKDMEFKWIMRLMC